MQLAASRGMSTGSNGQLARADTVLFTGDVQVVVPAVAPPESRPTSPRRRTLCSIDSVEVDVSRTPKLEKSGAVSQENTLKTCKPTGLAGDCARALQLGVMRTMGSSSSMPGPPDRLQAAISDMSSDRARARAGTLRGALTSKRVSEWIALESGSSFRWMHSEQFSRVRELARVSAEALLGSLGLPAGHGGSTLRYLSADAAPGHSSAFFFISHDRRYLLKSLSAADARCLVALLDAYTRRLEEARGRSLLPLFLGVLAVRFGRAGRAHTFLLQNNWFASEHALHARFDLKGASFASAPFKRLRTASARERKKGSAAVLKDADLKDTLVLGEEVLAALADDAAWLRAARLIDYSLLVGVHHKPAGLHAPPAPPTVRFGGGGGGHVVVVDSPEKLTMLGVVDILTPWTCRKRCEWLAFSLLKGGRDSSCQPPDVYSRRLLAFVRRHSDTPNLPRADGGNKGGGGAEGVATTRI